MRCEPTRSISCRDISLSAMHPDGESIKNTFGANEFIRVDRSCRSIPNRSMPSRQIEVSNLTFPTNIPPVESDSGAVRVKYRNHYSIVKFLVPLRIDEP